MCDHPTNYHSSFMVHNGVYKKQKMDCFFEGNFSKIIILNKKCFRYWTYLYKYKNNVNSFKMVPENNTIQFTVVKI